MKFLVKTTLVTCLLVLGGIVQPFSALAIFIDDFLVNSDLQKNSDDFPFVAVDGKGNFTVIWIKYCDDTPLVTPCNSVYMRRFDSNGNPLTSSIPLTPDSMIVLEPARIAMHPDGSFILTWTRRKIYQPPYVPIEIYAQQFDSTANRIGDLIRVDENAPDSQAFVWDIGIDSNKNFVILGDQGIGRETFARKFLSDGSPVGPPFSPRFCPTLDCTDSQFPYLDMLPDGRFLIIWYELVDEYNGDVPMGRFYDSSCQPVWSESRVLTCDDSVYIPHCGGTTGNCLIGNVSDVSLNNSGNFMLFTGACDGQPLNNNVYGRLLDSSGQGLTHNFKVNTVNPKTYDLQPRASSDGNGNFFAIWSDARYSYNEGPLDIFVQRYDSLANPIGSNWRINNPKGSAIFSWVAFDMVTYDDKAFIVWKDYRDWKTYPDFSDSIRTNIYGQLVDISRIGFYIPGDLNLDGQTNLSDLIWLVNYVFKGGSPPDPELWIGDLNADCKVNLADIIYFVNYLFKTGPKPQQGCA